MDDNIRQNTITITSKHIRFSQLNVIIFKTLKKLKGKQLYIYFDLDFDLKFVITTLKQSEIKMKRYYLS